MIVIECDNCKNILKTAITLDLNVVKGVDRREARIHLCDKCIDNMSMMDSLETTVTNIITQVIADDKITRGY